MCGSVPDEEHSHWNSQWINKKITSPGHKVRLQPQTKTMENTQSTLSSGKEHSKHSIYGESTCTATLANLVTQGK